MTRKVLQARRRKSQPAKYAQPRTYVSVTLDLNWTPAVPYQVGDEFLINGETVRVTRTN